MRLRNIPGADEKISSSPFCIQNPETYKGIWNQLFENNHPIHIEIGMGKGRFLLQLAQKNALINYIGIEKYTSVLLRAIQKLDKLPENTIPDNIRFLCTDAENLTNLFSMGEISKIYLNFSDPWPKKRHAERRLTSRSFLTRYDQILSKNGSLEFKTDNRLLFDFSLEELSASKWNLNACSYDLHHDPELNIENIMTEYEEKFSSLGNPIYKLIASRSF